YKPYGEERWSNGTSVTDFGFTSQRNERGFGLMDYNARYYSAVLGRFVSPDSIVPEPGSSGGFNRYRYTRNNPLKYVDPSGHCIVGHSGDVRMNEGSYGTSGICANTMSWTEEGTAARDEYVEMLEETQSIDFEDFIDYETGMPSQKVGPRSQAAADFLSGISLAADSGQVVLSAVGVGLTLASTLGGPLVVGGSQVAYEGSPLGGFERGLEVVSLGTTAGADYFGGNTYPHPEGLVVGQDTLVSLGTDGLGLIPLGPVYDTALNFVALEYNGSNFNEQSLIGGYMRDKLPGNTLIRRIGMPR
ncbi:MAG: RHS repeat-associated core domain-containing protein, partial [Deltaproteobacteria bacterium]|nr:RHS repeat-associated core domain-containing protein [Deltaproteobacteria bacterium]